MTVFKIFIALLVNLALLTFLWAAGASVLVARPEDRRAKAFLAAGVLISSTMLCAIILHMTIPFLKEWMLIETLIVDGRAVGSDFPVYLAFGLMLGGFVLGLSYVKPRSRVTWLSVLMVGAGLSLGNAYFGLHGATLLVWVFTAICLGARLPYELEWPKSGEITRWYIKIMVLLTLTYGCLLGYGRLRTPTMRWPVEKLIAALGDPQISIRRRAMRVVTVRGLDVVKALPTLDRILRNDPELGSEAAMAMARMGSKSLLVLSHRLMHNDQRVRITAARAIEAMGPLAIPGIEAIRDAVFDRSDEVRDKALDILGAFGPEAEETADMLIDLQMESEGKFSARLTEVLDSILGPEPPLPGVYDQLYDQEARQRVADKEATKKAAAEALKELYTKPEQQL